MSSSERRQNGIQRKKHSDKKDNINKRNNLQINNSGDNSIKEKHLPMKEQILKKPSRKRSRCSNFISIILGLCSAIPLICIILHVSGKGTNIIQINANETVLSTDTQGGRTMMKELNDLKSEVKQEEMVTRSYSEEINVKDEIEADSYCMPSGLIGKLNINYTKIPTLEETAKQNPLVKNGGSFRPSDCNPRVKTALICSYKDRPEHIRVFLNHIHPILQRQKLDYTIFIVEQDDDNKFNKGMLFNIGFLEAIKSAPYNCFIFHDVDLLLENDKNLYWCRKDTVRHLAVACNIYNHQLTYQKFMGGAFAITRDQYDMINGFSNRFWGWGGEDDEFAHRVVSNYPISRPMANIARYTMLKHHHYDINEDRHKLINEGPKFSSISGLSDIEDLYTVFNISQRKLYTLVRVKLEA